VGLVIQTNRQSAPQIGAPAAWEAGLTGQGVTVAVLDTGIDASHPGRGGGAVSLRAITADREGNTAEQTILDAYLLRGSP
jgi:subtilisin family serine protease